ncbi:MAG: hypothetical protein IAE97_00705 [Chthoniobacterales bacterium]|nr:hypothetical protein [Chthoniobacterales bacterium]
MNPNPPAPGSSERTQPAAFPAPPAEWNIERLQAGEPLIYISWGGEVYGPAAPMDVLAGLRAAWFEDDALFWFEGQKGWRPVAEFPACVGSDNPDDRLPADGALTAEAPITIPKGAPAALPAKQPRSSRSRGSSRKPKPGRRPGLGKRGALIVFGFALLAVGLTVGILLLLMMV